MAQAYLHDVFISYRRRSPAGDWVRNHFYPLLEQRLPDCLPIDHEARIFIDWDLETGVIWPDKLAEALKTSKCMLAVWSPEYFRSAWCLAEWKTMLERSRLLSQANPPKPPRLIYPVTFADGIHFPQEAKLHQQRDLRKWNMPHPSFKASQDYLDFDREMQALCEELSEMILQAPAWEDWPVVTPPPVANFKVDLPRL
jgi:hypothetical protein